MDGRGREEKEEGAGDRMEQITKSGDGWYYGQTRVRTPEMAYKCFRTDYNKSVGRDSNLRLNRLGHRTDVLHWSGSVFTRSIDDFDAKLCDRSVKSRIIGIVCTSYCKIIDFPQDVPDDNVDEYFDWLIQEGNSKLRLVGRKGGLGRTNKRQNKHFR